MIVMIWCEKQENYRLKDGKEREKSRGVLKNKLHSSLRIDRIQVDDRIGSNGGTSLASVGIFWSDKVRRYESKVNRALLIVKKRLAVKHVGRSAAMRMQSGHLRVINCRSISRWVRAVPFYMRAYAAVYQAIGPRTHLKSVWIGTYFWGTGDYSQFEGNYQGLINHLCKLK